MDSGEKTKTIHVNRSAVAKYDFAGADTFVCGVVLSGPDVKLVKDGQVASRDGYCSVSDGALYLYNLTIGHEKKTVKLLVNKKQLAAIQKTIETPGGVAVPVEVLEVRGWVKIRVSLVRGRKKHDKREYERAKEHKKEIREANG